MNIATIDGYPLLLINNQCTVDDSAALLKLKVGGRKNHAFFNFFPVLFFIPRPRLYSHSMSGGWKLKAAQRHQNHMQILLGRISILGTAV